MKRSSTWCIKGAEAISDKWMIDLVEYLELLLDPDDALGLVDEVLGNEFDGYVLRRASMACYKH